MAHLERQREEARGTLRGPEPEHDARHRDVGLHHVGEHQAEEGEDGAGAQAYPAGGRLQAWFQLEEDYRDGAAEEVATLAASGREVHLVSGDRQDRVAAAAACLGIEPARARGGMSPDAKAAYLRAIDDHDTLMVGDGLNDAPAFAAAWCAGTPAMDRPVLPARADFFFRGAQAGSVLAVLDVAQALRATVRTNLRLAVLYNAGALVPCCLGLMTPLLCAVLMPLSSIALVLHTVLRLGGRRRVVR